MKDPMMKHIGPYLSHGIHERAIVRASGPNAWEVQLIQNDLTWRLSAHPLSLGEDLSMRPSSRVLAKRLDGAPWPSRALKAYKPS